MVNLHFNKNKGDRHGLDRGGGTAQHVKQIKTKQMMIDACAYLPNTCCLRRV
jgi:hypothetical protein